MGWQLRSCRMRPAGRRAVARTAALAPLLLALGCSAELPPGVHFETTRLALGSLTSGEVRDVEFPFQVVGEAVTVEDLLESCGCANPRLLVSGEPHPFGAPIDPGTRGSVVVSFHTFGFVGEKHASVEVVGSGPGLPVELEFQADLRPFYRTDPEVLEVRHDQLRKGAELSLLVRAPEPFRLSRVAALPTGWSVGGLPSPAAAQEQWLTVAVPPDGNALQRQPILRILDDQGRELLVRIAAVADFWMKPETLIPLGTLQAGVPTAAALDLGVRRGVLGKPGYRVEGLPEAAIHCVTLKEGRSYRIQIQVPGDLPPGPFLARLELDLRHELDGEEKLFTRQVRIAGLVTDPSDRSSSSEQ